MVHLVLSQSMCTVHRYIFRFLVNVHVTCKDNNDLECLLAAIAIRHTATLVTYSCCYRALSSCTLAVSCPQIMLAFSDGKQYDSVYPNSYIESSAICQCKSVFEIALVRLSETSDYLHGQVNNPSALIRWTSEKLQPDCIVQCRLQIKRL